jgi:hypothetical protein
MMADEREKEYLHSMFETLVHWYEVREMTLIVLMDKVMHARVLLQHYKEEAKAYEKLRQRSLSKLCAETYLQLNQLMQSHRGFGRDAWAPAQPFERLWMADEEEENTKFRELMALKERQMNDVRKELFAVVEALILNGERVNFKIEDYPEDEIFKTLKDDWH